ncbi:SDR family oxidoreductase [Brachybacterium sacelli]|nr:NAD(P)H-binding protein [Brachybacterium sacelli]
MKIAVIGATGTAGSRTVATLKNRGLSPVKVSRSTGVDLITGKGLTDALDGVDVVIDTSNAFPPDETIGLHEALTSATRHIVEACVAQRVGHLVFLSINGVDSPVFDDFPYYVAKRAQDDIVANSNVPSTVVKSSQWHEFATNPSAVTFEDEEVRVEDWLIQPVAADTVAEALVEAALGRPGAGPRTIAGPETIRLPELTTKLLSRLGGPRPVRTTAPALPALSEGALLAPDHAAILGPDIDTWLHTVDTAT